MTSFIYLSSRSILRHRSDENERIIARRRRWIGYSGAVLDARTQSHRVRMRRTALRLTHVAVDHALTLLRRVGRVVRRLVRPDGEIALKAREVILHELAVVHPLQKVFVAPATLRGTGLLHRVGLGLIHSQQVGGPHRVAGETFPIRSHDVVGINCSARRLQSGEVGGIEDGSARREPFLVRDHSRVSVVVSEHVEDEDVVPLEVEFLQAIVCAALELVPNPEELGHRLERRRAEGGLGVLVDPQTENGL